LSRGVDETTTDDDDGKYDDADDDENDENDDDDDDDYPMTPCERITWRGRKSTLPKSIFGRKIVAYGTVTVI
jgi:hypothetical protein